jgi:hypothetical protein
MAEPSPEPRTDPIRIEYVSAEQIDEIDAGGSLLPAGLARVARARAVRWAARGVAAVLALAALAAATAGAVRRFGVTDGMGSAAETHTGLPTPFDRVLALAHQPELRSNIRQASAAGECALVTPGFSPEQAVLAMLRGILPDVRDVESARTLYQFTGLCALQLRASAPDRVRVVVMISSPPAHPPPNTLDAVEVGLENTGPETVEYVQETMHTSWEILIGAVGDVSGLPRTMDLTTAAALPQLQW